MILAGVELGFVPWLGITGALLLSMALASEYVRRMPISTAAIYLAAGLAFGPVGLGWVHLDMLAMATWVEHVTEIAVIFSLFTTGLKLRRSLRHPSWTAVVRLAGPAMVLTIGGVALVARWGFGLDAGSALLLGAALAPTDPVLARAVQVADARDDDPVRYGLSGEAGLNDGLALPFVVLALEWNRHGAVGGWIGGWAARHLLWAVPVGLGIGFLVGWLLGRVAIWLRHRHRDTSSPNDFFALALMAIAYALAEAVHAGGFLAVFAAGLGLRRAEVAVVAEAPHPNAGEGAHDPAEHLVAANEEDEALEEPAVAAGVVVGEAAIFGDTMDRFLEVMLVLGVGAAIASYLDVRGLVLAGALMLVIRPGSVFASLIGSKTSTYQRGLMAWLGVRGIGTVYYLAYAGIHGFDRDELAVVARITLTVVATSIVVHGVSASPLLGRYARAAARRPA